MAESKTGKRNGVGVLLYGCNRLRGMREGYDSDGERMMSLLPSTHELVELTPPGIEQVTEIQKCLDGRDL